MGFFTNLRSDRLIQQIKSTNEPLGEETLKSVAKLKDLGPGVIQPVMLALADADKNATVALVDVLSTLVSNKTFPLFVEGLCDGSPAHLGRHRLGADQQPAPMPRACCSTR